MYHIKSITQLNSINMGCPGEWEGELMNGYYIHIQDEVGMLHYEIAKSKNHWHYGQSESYTYPINPDPCLSLEDLAAETEGLFNFSNILGSYSSKRKYGM